MRLAGLEIVARLDVRNYAVPLRWPLAWWNPLNVTPASQLDCTVRFSVLREHFTPIQTYFDRDEPIAVQHGLRLLVTATGSVGYFSWESLMTKVLLAFTAFSVAQQLLDTAWYYLSPHASAIAGKAFLELDVASSTTAAAAKASRKAKKS